MVAPQRGARGPVGIRRAKENAEGELRSQAVAVYAQLYLGACHFPRPVAVAEVSGPSPLMWGSFPQHQKLTGMQRCEFQGSFDRSGLEP